MERVFPSPDLVLQIRKTLPATPERVFRAFTDVEVLKKWWGPEGFTTPMAELDVRVGGSYRIAMKPPEGDVVFLSGVYREVVPPEKLVFTWNWEGEGAAMGETLVTVEIHGRGQMCELVVTHEAFPNKDVRDQHDEGWTSHLSRLSSVA